MICKMCCVDKAKIKTDKVNSQGHIYVDATGRGWAGRKCPDCRNSLNKPKKKLRKCTKCKRMLPKTRWFKCEVCQPVLPRDFLDGYQDWTSSNSY